MAAETLQTRCIIRAVQKLRKSHTHAHKLIAIFPKRKTVKAEQYAMISHLPYDFS